MRAPADGGAEGGVVPCVTAADCGDGGVCVTYGEQINCVSKDGGACPAGCAASQESSGSCDCVTPATSFCGTPSDCMGAVVSGGGCKVEWNELGCP